MNDGMDMQSDQEPQDNDQDMASEGMEKTYSPSELHQMAATVMKAREIEADPEIMEQLAPMLQDAQGPIRSIDDLKKARNQMNMMQAPEADDSSAPAVQEY